MESGFRAGLVPRADPQLCPAPKRREPAVPSKEKVRLEGIEGEREKYGCLARRLLVVEGSAEGITEPSEGLPLKRMIVA